MQIKISGYPLTAPITLTAEEDEHLIGKGFLLNHDETQRLIEAWCDAPTTPAPNGETDVLRTWSYSELGLFITVLHMEGELTMDHWESVVGNNGTDLYSTTEMPFDFTVHTVGLTDLTGTVERVSREIAETVDLAEHPVPGSRTYRPVIEDIDQLAAFITDGIYAYLRRAQISTTGGYTYTPQITDDSIGYVITAPSGTEETLTLAPEIVSWQGDGTGTVTVTRAESRTPGETSRTVTEVTFTDSGTDETRD